jgi:hypothetical protein
MRDIRRRVDNHRIVPRHHPAVTIEPFTGLRAERRLREQTDKRLIGLVGAISHDHFIGDLDPLALQFTTPLIDGALGATCFGAPRRSGKESEIVG